MKKFWLPVAFVVGGIIGGLIFHLIEHNQYEKLKGQLVEATNAFLVYHQGYVSSMKALKDIVMQVPDEYIVMTESLQRLAEAKEDIDVFESEEHEIFVPF